MSKPVAIITGAASGIGLALTRHLVSKGWRVAMADIDSENGSRLSSELGADTIFQQTDVSNYADQARLFSRAFPWGGNRLDFLSANAGIDDRQSLYERNETLDAEGMPKEMNLKTIRVDLDAVIQGIWLFKHYARKNSTPGGKIVITSSAAGIYSMATNPLYTSAKYGLVGLARACGPHFAEENITVNCICPSFVPTGLCPPHVLHKFPKEHITPMSTVLKAFDTFIGDNTMTGQTVELSLGHLYFRKQPEWANESQKWLGEESGEFWKEAYEPLTTTEGNL
ncbi:hypothetical protein V500_02852 [Pseudogymnoascus sp. VKM F-4518 (FW-2643)]|nr:hypothetical protein V500_02852 [Pseudogymnoascus sp. VKM F-4518 (FW-2643)]